MRTTAAWAFWRRAQYISGFTFLGVLALVGAYYAFFYTAASCFDGEQNGAEIGIDCGGGCARICAFTVTMPQVQWARSFKITDGQYNAVAYVENRNLAAATPELRYTFSLYDDAGLITERSGTTILPPDSVYPIFEGNIMTGSRVPTRTFLDIEEPELWVPASGGRDQFTIVERTLSGVDTNPRLDAVVRNNDLEEASEVELVATIFDRDRNALTSSRTYVENFAPRADTNIVFTWPQPIAKTLRSCEVPTDVLMAIDLSGSMNDDGGTPPEPVTSVLSAASRFVSRLGSEDQAGLVTFATDAAVTSPLTRDIAGIGRSIAALSIAPEEETGSTNTGAAFEQALTEFSSGRHDPAARRVLVILTDGRATAPDEDPEGYAIARATALKAADVEVYAIGLGENVNAEFIRNIATDDAHAFQALTNADIDRIYENITTALCEEGPAVIEIIPKTDAKFEALDAS